jgi:acetylserotonin O-methyltransferase
VANDLTPADPSTVLELLEAFRRSKIMFTGVSLGVFDALVESPKAAAELAPQLGCDADAMRRLLESLVGVGLLERSGDLFHNTPAANEYLTSGSPTRMTGYVQYSNRVMWQMWGNLEGAIQEGTHRWQQTYGWDGPIFSSFFKTEEAMREFLMGMHGFGMITSPKVVSAIDLSRFKRLVDLGGATGHLAMAACQRYPEMRATVFDLPAAIPLAREIAGQSNVAARIDFVADTLPPGESDPQGRRGPSPAPKGRPSRAREGVLTEDGISHDGDGVLVEEVVAFDLPYRDLRIDQLADVSIDLADCYVVIGSRILGVSARDAARDDATGGQRVAGVVVIGRMKLQRVRPKSVAKVEHVVSTGNDRIFAGDPG